MKKALITGISGQDGPYLAKLLLEKGYDVFGFNKQRTPLDNLKKLGIFGSVVIIEGDLTDSDSIGDAIARWRPDEIYNLAAQSHVGYSFTTPHMTCSVNYMGYLNLLLAARYFVPYARIYQAGTSEMFGYAAQGKQNEETPLQPKSPYAISKVAAHWAGVNARHETDQFVSNGILFNHESPIRHPSFVTRKITDGVKNFCKNGVPIRLGNIDSRRDWGYAGDYVKAMWLMLQHDKPDDFVIATGEVHSVREFLIAAWEALGEKIWFDGSGEQERGYVGKHIVMVIDPALYRPNELNYLCGDSSKAASVLRWQPKTGFNELVKRMMPE